MVIAIIPARFGSSRLPGKVLMDIHGKTLIQRVYEQAMKSTLIDQVWIATDHQDVYQEVQSFQGKVLMTSAELNSGTDRCAEALEQLKLPAKFVLNIQGDEPFLDPLELDMMVEYFIDHNPQILTLVCPLMVKKSLLDPDVVKCVKDLQGKAMYFSRSSIPYVRDGIPESKLYSGMFYQHIGIYGFRPSVLTSIAELKPTTLEQAEKLEQLRWLENGYSIATLEIDKPHLGIDNPADLEQARRILSESVNNEKDQ